MKNIGLYLLMTLSALSCTRENVGFDGCVTMDVTLGDATKVTLTGADAVLKSGRVWKWETGDKPVYTYSLKGVDCDVTPSVAQIDASNPALMRVKMTGVPDEAVFNRIRIGDAGVLGKTAEGGSTIPSSLVYASSPINAEAGEENLPGITLEHQCSYFLVYPDVVTVGKTEYTIKDIEITGHSLTGTGKDETISITLYNSSSRTTTSKWLALSSSATDIVFTGSYGSGKAVMATIASAGGGRCCLFEITNKSIGVQYQ